MLRDTKAAAIGIALLAWTLVGCDGGGTAAAQQSRAPMEAQIREQLGDVPTTLDTASAAQLSGAFRAAADRALPAVVQVRVVSTRTTASAQGNLPFRIPGWNFEEAPRRSEGTGSGFVIDDAGHILTNHHVVENAERVEVVLADGRDFDAEVIGSDPNTDVAVIRIRARNGERLPVSQFGDSDVLRVGDWVLALGNPLGLSFTVTAGIVSAKGRSIGILRNTDGTHLESFIQTDAAINPGNSGGPMVDLLGRVVGINTAISSQTGFFAGAGFAIPINLARKVADDLIRYGVVHRPRLGISIRPARAADAEVFRLPAVTGAVVAQVVPNEPAARAGIQMGDVITAVEGVAIRTDTDLQAQVARYHPGDRIRLDYIRYGEARQATVQLGEFQAQRDRTASNERPASGAALLGFTTAEVPAEIARQSNWRAEWRVVVREVDRFGPVAGVFGPGTVIVRLNGRDVTSPRDVDRLAAGIRAGDVVSVVFLDPRDNPEPIIFNYRAR